MNRILAILCFLQVLSVTSQISLDRKISLDSFVYNLPEFKSFRIDSVHNRMHHFGRSDEERAYLFYSYSAQYNTYDYARFYARRTKEYTPEYTCQIGSGVCRDFAELFRSFCFKSNIDCIYVSGKIPMSIWKKIGLCIRLKFHLLNAGHAWNLVKYNEKWHAIDVTWARIEKGRKFYEVDEKGKSRTVAKSQDVSSKYFDVEPEIFLLEHKPYNPLYALHTVCPTFKTAFKKEKRRTYLSYQINYDSILNSLFETEYNVFSPQEPTSFPEYHAKNEFITKSKYKGDLLQRNIPDEYRLTDEEWLAYKAQMIEYCKLYDMDFVKSFQGIKLETYLKLISEE